MINMNKYIVRSVAILTVFLCLILSNNAAASNSQTAGGFSIHAIIPDNQVDKSQTYFDLRMRPGDEQTIEIVINNTRDEELVAETLLNPASTGRNGLIVYTESNRGESEGIAITDVASIRADSVTVPPHDSRSLMIDIKMPEKSIDGVILGGVAISGGEADSGASAAQGVSLKNKITYVIALKLTENDREIAADFDLTSITPELINYKTAVVATLNNKAARIVKDMEIDAKIFKKGSSMVLNELVRGNVEMAPMSNGDFVIDWKNKPLEQGTYRLKMTAVYDGRTWEWDEEFTIGMEAGDLNNGAVGLVKNYTWLYVLFGVIVLTAVWLIAYRLGRRTSSDEGLQARK